jgi:hypothetical protein
MLKKIEDIAKSLLPLLGLAVVQLFEALCHKIGGSGFNSQ